MTFSRMKRDYYALDSLRNLCTQILNTEKCIKDWHREIQESNITVAQLVTLNVEDEQAINTILGSNQEAGNNATHNGISFSSRNTSGKVRPPVIRTSTLLYPDDFIALCLLSVTIIDSYRLSFYLIVGPESLSSRRNT